MFAICVFIILTNLKTTMYFTNLNHTNTLNGITRSNTIKPIRRSEKVAKKPHNILEYKQLTCYEQQRFTQNIIVLDIPWPRRVWVTIFYCQKQKVSETQLEDVYVLFLEKPIKCEFLQNIESLNLIDFPFPSPLRVLLSASCT